MTDKNFDFNNTRDALSQLSTDLLQLESAIKLKRSQLAENNKKTSEQLEKQEKIIASLTKVSEDALVKIDNITDFIDGVL
ncbi:MAG: hypothetical protein E7004_03380 [Alphaproteobacteria bacterium]|jgi:hypothetical protein|nr:hypothetical protein [Alphaproteobacteria bacterium]